MVKITFLTYKCHSSSAEMLTVCLQGPESFNTAKCTLSITEHSHTGGTQISLMLLIADCVLTGRELPHTEWLHPVEGQRQALPAQ